MSLILTELSNAGIAMVTDSAISFLDKEGRVSTKDQKQWDKLIKVPKIQAAIAYWGSIGYVTRERFDHWLQRRIDTGNYEDLPSFADYLAVEMNKASKGKPLPDEQPVGVHVAGFHNWADGVKRPTFYHIHNGHGRVRFDQRRIQGVLVETNPHYEWSPRELFSRHNDFPPEGANCIEWVEMLNLGYVTRNGDYAPFVIISGGLLHTCAILNTIPGVSVPRDTKAVGSRVGVLKLLMETVISIYKCSSMSKTIGGKVQTLGIRPDATYL